VVLGRGDAGADGVGVGVAVGKHEIADETHELPLEQAGHVSTTDATGAAETMLKAVKAKFTRIL
jgi:hypothetical protein